MKVAISNRLVGLPLVLICSLFAVLSSFIPSSIVHANGGFQSHHFYTTSVAERDNAIKNLGFVDESGFDSIYVFLQPVPGSVRLYRFYNEENSDHFYATDEVDRSNALNSGYVDESNQNPMYVFRSTTPIRVATHLVMRFYNSSTGDHFYATDVADHDRAVYQAGYTQEYSDPFYAPYEEITYYGVKPVKLWRLYHGDTNENNIVNPHIDVATEGRGNSSIFTITGSQFELNHPVHVRVTDDASHTLWYQATSDSSGNIRLRQGIPCIEGLALHFSANDERSDNNDITGTLWSNTVTISCP